MSLTITYALAELTEHDVVRPIHQTDPDVVEDLSCTSLTDGVCKRTTRACNMMDDSRMVLVMPLELVDGTFNTVW